MSLSEDEVAQQAGTTRERVRRLVDLGILTSGPDPGAPFRDSDGQRVRLVGELEALGLAPESVATAIAGGALSLDYLDKLPGPPSRSTRAYEDVRDELGLDGDLLDRIYIGFGLPRPRPEDHLREEDVAILAELPILFKAGLGEPEVLRAARVWGEGVRGVAQHQVHSFHDLIEEPFRQRGLSDDQALGAAMSEVGARLLPFCERVVTWLYRRHFEAYATEHRIGHVETALEAAGLISAPAPDPVACVFADLSGYTNLTERQGDAAAARIALRLAALMQEIASRHDGRVIKMLGDGVHLLFDVPANAVLGSLDLVAKAEPSGLPPAHVGVTAGPMIYIDGDYYGRTVNLAARIAEEAGPGQVYVSDTIAENADIDGVRFEHVGPRSMKGIDHPVMIHRAVRVAS